MAAWLMDRWLEFLLQHSGGHRGGKPWYGHVAGVEWHSPRDLHAPASCIDDWIRAAFRQFQRSPDFVRWARGQG